MAKRSQRRPLQYKKGQAGCIWGFISIFDFRHGRATRKLLSDRKHPSTQVIGAGSRSKLHMLTNSPDNSQELYDGKERDNMTAEATKASVKELMEEDMFCEEGQKMRMIGAEAEAGESDSEEKVCTRKNRKERTSRTSKSFCDLHYELNAAEDLGHQDSEEKTLENLDLEGAVNKLYQQIYLKSSSCKKHNSNNGLDIELEKTRSVLDLKLSKAIKVFMDQRLTDEKIKHSTEFMDALETLSSNKEVILELLKDQNSCVVKHIEGLGDAQLEVKPNSNLLAGELNNSVPSLPVARKHHNFFQRRSKSQEKIPFEGDENCRLKENSIRASNQIVILKPGPEAERKINSSLQSHNDSGAKLQSERIASRFSFTEIRRKWNQALGKERHGVHSDDITYRIPHERQNSGNADKGVGGEKVGWNSPNRDHFYNERFARPTGTKKKDKGMGIGTIEHPGKRASNIYVEGKKHLSDLLSSGYDSEEFSSRRSPKTLGRILSLPEFNFSPVCSPRIDKEHSSVKADRELSYENNNQDVNEDASQLTKEKHIIPSCISDNPEDKVQSCDSQSDVLDEVNHVNAGGGDEVIVQTTDALAHEERDVLKISAGVSASSVITDEQNGDIGEVLEERGSFQYLESDSYEQDQLISSPLRSPPTSSIAKQVGHVDSDNERLEQPSPISVLEPLFSEDDVSPASIKCQTVELPMQPLRIPFEEQLSSDVNQEICLSACLEDEESAYEYVEAVLLASDLNWEEFLLRWLSSDPILDLSLFDEVELFSNRSHHDQKLLFDCTNEVLNEVCERYFGFSPWVSFVKHNVRPIPRKKDLICEVWEGVEWHLLPQPTSHSLEQIVRKDVARSGTWMDLRFDVENIGIDIGQAIFEDVLEDTILSFVNVGSELVSSVLMAESIEDELQKFI